MAAVRATKVTKGATLKGATDPGGLPPNRGNELTLAMASFVEAISTDGVPTTSPAMLPDATGRDNLYHQYFVTIEPDPGVDGDLVISLKQFEDNVKPIANQYTRSHCSSGLE